MELAQLSRLEDGGTNAQEHKHIRTQCNFVPLRLYFAGAIPKLAPAGGKEAPVKLGAKYYCVAVPATAKQSATEIGGQCPPYNLDS